MLNAWILHILPYIYLLLKMYSVVSEWFLIKLKKADFNLSFTFTSLQIQTGIILFFLNENVMV